MKEKSTLKDVANNYLTHTKNEKGITLIALVITIIVLLILAGVTVATLKGDNGILTKTNEAKENTEIKTEKEIIKLAVLAASEKEDYKDISKEKLQNELEQLSGGETEVYSDNKSYIIYFKETDRVYKVDENININQEEKEIVEKDNTPGELDGKGKEEDPYIIKSIEDLVYFSKETKEGRKTKEYIKLGKTLDFESELSYCNYLTKEYNDFLGISDDVGLKEALTNKKYKGYTPIAAFYGIFDGNNREIRNLYECNYSEAGLFSRIINANIKDIKVSGNIINTGNTGGIAGYAGNCNIINCYNYININSNGSTGGIIGLESGNGKIVNCYNYGNVSGKPYGVGGIIGYNIGHGETIKILNSGNSGIVENKGGISYSGAGGIIGLLQTDNINIDIYNCYNAGKTISTHYAGNLDSFGGTKR